MSKDIITKAPSRLAWAKQLNDQETPLVEAYVSALNATQAPRAAGVGPCARPSAQPQAARFGRHCQGTHRARGRRSRKC